MAAAAKKAFLVVVLGWVITCHHNMVDNDGMALIMFSKRRDDK